MRPWADPGGPSRSEPDHDSNGSTGSSESSVDALLARLRSIWVEADGHIDGDLCRVGKYEFIRDLGRGTFGRVVLVRDPTLDCRWALKIPSGLVQKHPRLRARFLDDARFAIRIDHTNVVRVVHAEELGELCFFAMEFCPEGSLGSWLADRPEGWRAPETWAASLVQQVADGVHRVHLEGIVHRDLKPSNVLLVGLGSFDRAGTPEFTAKVADFGLAAFFDDPDATATFDGLPVGTVAYMSPEQARGTRKQIGPASDVYGLGAILFEILAGRRAYPQKESAAILEAILSEGPSPALDDARPGISPDLKTIVAVAMAKHPSDRYASAAEMADDLRRFSRDEAVKGSAWWKKGRSWARKRRSKLSAAAGIMLAGTIVGTAFEFRARGNADVWFRQVEAADPSALPALIETYQSRAEQRLHALFAGQSPDKKLNAAVILADQGTTFADHAYDRLLSATPEEITPLARALGLRLPGLRLRLERDAATPSESTNDDEVARHDRSRANAACAAIRLDESTAAWSLFKHDPNPQARSFLIHNLGAMRMPPKVVTDRLRVESNVSARRALILALGEVAPTPEAPGLPKGTADSIFTLYRDDPDPGIHGAAKWLLFRWQFREKVAEVDDELGKRDHFGYRTRFRWRVGPTGLTFVHITIDSLKREVEMTDTEVTVRQFRKLVPDAVVVPDISPWPDCPMTFLRFQDAARFCVALSKTESLPERDRCYIPDAEGVLMLAPDRASAHGYRLPTDIEFDDAAAAGAVTSRYFGNSDVLLPFYARASAHDSESRTHLVATLKPNDLGLFDCLGNAGDLAQAEAAAKNPYMAARIRGGSYLSEQSMMTHGFHRGASPFDVRQPHLYNFDWGFRVARTLRP